MGVMKRELPMLREDRYRNLCTGIIITILYFELSHIINKNVLIINKNH